MIALLKLIDTVLGIYIWVLIASAVFSWLIAFNVVNNRNQFVSQVGEFLWRITEPVLRPIRRFVPFIGGVDVSPIILILVIYFLRDFIRYDLMRAFM